MSYAIEFVVVLIAALLALVASPFVSKISGSKGLV